MCVRGGGCVCVCGGEGVCVSVEGGWVLVLRWRHVSRFMTFNGTFVSAKMRDFKFYIFCH